jgi:hypothetical protein
LAVYSNLTSEIPLIQSFTEISLQVVAEAILAPEQNSRARLHDLEQQLITFPN